MNLSVKLHISARYDITMQGMNIELVMHMFHYVGVLKNLIVV